MVQQTDNDLQALAQGAWDLKKRFLEFIEPYRTDLWRYCRSLTGCPWDAEDLVQETLLKALSSLGQIWQPLFPKSYLFRIATNTWINQCRRNQRIQFTVFEEELGHADQAEEQNRFAVYESIEWLVRKLPPKQACTVLLIEVFRFTSKETAEMLGSTEGAVKALLHRARKNLESWQQNGMSESDANSVSAQKGESPMINQQVIDRMIETFHQRDPDAMAMLFAENAHNDIVHVGQEYGRETIRKYSIRDTFDHWTSELKAHFQVLWGRPVLIVLIDTATGWQLKSILYLETEGDSIVYKKEYYFCEDLLDEAAKELNVAVHDRGR